MRTVKERLLHVAYFERRLAQPAGSINRFEVTSDSETVDFLQFGFDGLLALPRHGTETGMQRYFIEDEDKIALADSRSVKTVRAVQADVQLFGVALELVASQAVDLQSVRVI